MEKTVTDGKKKKKKKGGQGEWAKKMQTARYMGWWRADRVEEHRFRHFQRTAAECPDQISHDSFLLTRRNKPCRPSHSSKLFTFNCCHLAVEKYTLRKKNPAVYKTWSGRLRWKIFCIFKKKKNRVSNISFSRLVFKTWVRWNKDGAPPPRSPLRWKRQRHSYVHINSDRDAAHLGCITRCDLITGRSNKISVLQMHSKSSLLFFLIFF